MKATDLLKEEHQIILKALKILDALCRALEKGQKVPFIHLEQIMNFMTVYTSQYHHGKEENILLPYLDACVLPEKIKYKYIEEIIDEHLLQRGYVEAMGQALAESTHSIPPPKFVIQARNLIGLLDENIVKENHFLLPEVDKFLTREQHKELLKKLITSETKDDKKNIEVLCNTIIQLEKIYIPQKPSCCGCGGDH